MHIVIAARASTALIAQRQVKRGTQRRGLAVGEGRYVVRGIFAVTQSGEAAVVEDIAGVTDARAIYRAAALRSDLLSTEIGRGGIFIPTRQQAIYECASVPSNDGGAFSGYLWRRRW